MPRENHIELILNSLQAKEISFQNKEEKEFSPSIAEKVYKFHQSLDEYKETPLQSLDNLADYLSLKKIWVKDESFRFNLNAFKGLGASYALAEILKEKLEIQTDQNLISHLNLPDIKSQIQKLTFVTATDGNHGRAVAWGAKNLGCKAVIYMPRGSSKSRLQAIKSFGAEARIVDMNYDDAVRFAASQAQKNNWILVQDTAWEGYVDIPQKIMQGYLTIAQEISQQLAKININEHPTHIFIQCGVGSFAAAIQLYLIQCFGSKRPKFIVAEPKNADCFFQSIKNKKRTTVDGDLNSIMAGLSCGEPSIVAWDILSKYADAFLRCDDEITKDGMRILSQPLKNDPKIISGESGAVCVGALVAIYLEPHYKKIKKHMKLNNQSKVLFISTEGNTDPEQYNEIIKNRYNYL